MSSSDLNYVLLEISNALSADQLSELKFLCPFIGKRKLEQISSGRQLFDVLKERGKLNADYLSELFRGIKRDDLADKVKTAQEQSGPPVKQPDEAEKVNLDIATEVIAESLGIHWRKLGRKLRLTEVKLESISKRHPTDLEETAVELLKEWRKIQGAEARTEELIRALRACQFNLTADKVEDRLSTLTPK